MKGVLKKISGAVALSVAVIIFLQVGIFVLDLNAQQNEQARLDAQYEANKKQVTSQLDNITNQIDSLIAENGGLSEQETTLNGQVNGLQSQMRQIDSLITDTKIVTSQVEKEIEKNELELKKENDKIREVFREYQIYQKDSLIKSVFSSENIGVALSKLYRLEQINSRLDEVKQQKVRVKRRLDDSYAQNLQIQDQLEKSRGLLKSRESGLSTLLNETSGEQAKYDQLLQAIKDQKSLLETELGTIEGEYLAEIEDLRQEELEEQYYTQKTDCRFEPAEGLNVPFDYFTRPTIGYVTQKFHCGHDAIDIANSRNTDIYAVADGEVVRKGPNNTGCVGLGCNGGFGNYVVVKHVLPSGQRTYSLYAHMNTPSSKSVGQQVSRGEVIGKMGCTGFTKPFPCGVHLHFALYSDSYETQGLGCKWGNAKCYNPQIYINPIN